MRRDEWCYCHLAECLIHLADWVNDGRTFDEIRQFHYNYEHSLLPRPLLDEEEPSSEHSVVQSIETLKNFLGVDNDNTKLDKLIYEWNENIASIIGVKCSTFEEFADQVARVSSDWAKAVKTAEVAQQQQPVQQPVQSQSQQTFVDVNTLLSENIYLKLVNEHKDKDIDILKARLTALGQTV